MCKKSNLRLCIDKKRILGYNDTYEKIFTDSFDFDNVCRNDVV